ncbi:MAG: amidohydrolase [Pseudomonadota bacterium]|nr:amidohydrolase [Pseudomonadota bacterium]
MLLKHVLHANQICDIEISGNKIAHIAPHIDLQNDTIWDCSGKAILPSFANLHTHTPMMFLRGIGEDKTLMDWLENAMWPLEAKLKPEHFYPICRFAILEMIKTGTTFFLDMYGGNPEETVRAVDHMGIRAAVPSLALDFFKPTERENRLSMARKFLSDPCPNRVIKGLSCHAIYTCSEELIKTLLDWSRQRNTFFHMHLSETETEVNECVQKYGCRPVELMKKWGVLGPQTIMAHCVHFNDSEIHLMADSQTVVAHCPTSNLKLGSGQMDLQKYLEAGIPVALGTDSVASNNSLSMMSEMKIAALSAKNKAESVLAAKVGDIFHLATRAGFEFFGLNAGVIAEGALADFILVDLNAPCLLPNTNLISHMIYSADSSCITDVVCDGVPVMKNGHVPHEDEIISAFKETCRQLIG